MKVRHKSDKVEIEVDGKDAKDCFSQLAGAVEVFSHSVCQACDSPRTIPSVRSVDGNNFFEMRCLDCGATLGFGQKKQDGSLFPRKRDKEGNWLDNGGWLKWKPKDEAVNF